MSSIFTSALSRTLLQYDLDNEVFGLFSFNPPAIKDSTRAPLDLAVALDNSGSMGGGRGSKMENARRSLLKLVEHLKPGDRLGIVLFDSSVNVLFEPMEMTPANKKKAIEAIKSVRSDSMTNLSGGLLKALSFFAAKVPKGTVRRCLLFTDGQANKGITDADSILTAAAETRGGAPISTFGYGNDCNSDLLNNLAVDGGNYHYIDTPDKILSAFGVELGGLISTYGQNVEISLKPQDGVEIRTILNDLSVDEKDDGTVVVTCDDLLAEQPYHLVVQLKVDPRKNTHPRGIALVKATATFYDVANTTPQELTASMKAKFVKAGKADTKEDPQVMEEVALQRVVAAQADAIKLADEGNFAGAQKVLRSASAYSIGVGTDTSRKLGEATEGMMREYFHNQAAYAAGGRQKSTATRGLLRRRTGGSAGLEAGGVQMGALFSSRTQSDTRALFEANKDPNRDRHSKDLTPNSDRQYTSFGGVGPSDGLNSPEPVDSKKKKRLSKRRSDRW